jgi:AraC-like DNA-binding protein
VGVFDKLVGHVIDLDFNTHEAMIEAALLWNIEEYQLDIGPFVGILKGIHTAHIQIGNASRSNGVLIKGSTPKNCYMFATVHADDKKTHNGLTIYDEELIILNESDQLDFTVNSSFNDMTVAIDKFFFDRAFEAYFNKPFKYDNKIKRIQLKQNAVSNFRISVKKMLADLINQHDRLKNDKVFHDQVENNILEIIFENIDFTRKRKDVLQSEMNANEIRTYIENHYNEYIKVNALAEKMNFSKRTIRLSFNHLFGFSPKQYLESYRMGKVHHNLLKSDHNIETVERIAYDGGFTHMGRFSENYKSMFGKTPSSTLKTTLIL